MSSDQHILNAQTRMRFQCAFRACSALVWSMRALRECARIRKHLRDAHFLCAFQNGPENQSRTGREPGTGERWQVRP